MINSIFVSYSVKKSQLRKQLAVVRCDKKMGQNGQTIIPPFAGIVLVLS